MTNVTKNRLNSNVYFYMALLKMSAHSLCNRYSMYNSLSTYDYPMSEFGDIIKWSKFSTEMNYRDYLSRLHLLPTWVRLHSYFILDLYSNSLILCSCGFICGFMGQKLGQLNCDITNLQHC